MGIAQEGGRRAARLAAIDRLQRQLEAQDHAAQEREWDETTQFGIDARNHQWRRLENERRLTLATA